MADDDEDEGFVGLYEDGHWVWDDSIGSLIFISDLPPVAVEAPTIMLKAPTGTIEFRDDIDVLEQMRFRRRYQRKLKPGQADVITVQDVKDIALFTAPFNLLSPSLINFLHQSTTERFIRALIFYCQYYLQIVEEMTLRMKELQVKIRTPECDVIENVFNTNLQDLRLLISKEYCIMLIGGGDTKKYHHMGPQKKRKSLSDKDARLIETLIRICVQIVWLALGRKSFNQIELEVNRLFKSEIFNAVEHNLKTGYISKMTREERAVLLGSCIRRDKKLNTCSPLANEVYCDRIIDYRLVGLGVIKYQTLSPRLLYMYYAVVGSEEKLNELQMTIGILGMSRAVFDTMLRPLPTAGGDKGKSKISVSSVSHTSMASRKSVGVTKLYPDIVLPPKEEFEQEMPKHFPCRTEAPRACSETQRRRWLNRYMRLMQPSCHRGTKSSVTLA